jgi:pimeloyl-ACP methyl ester carboxylesterase
VQPDSSFIEANGLRFHVLRWWVSGERGPLLLNHATGFVAALWQPIATRLAGAGFDVYAYDARGHGDSDKPEVSAENYHWLRMAEDLDAIMGVLGIGGAGFAGHSMGGGTGLYVAGGTPGIFSRLAVVEPIVMPGGFEPDEPRRNAMAEGARRRRASFSSRDEMIEQYRKRPTFSLWTDEALHLYAEQGTFDGEDGTVLLKCTPAVEGEIFSLSGSLSIWDRLPSIEVPVLVMAGETTEPFLDMVGRGVADRVQDGRFLQLPQAGHLAPMERPDLVADELLAFLAG